MRVVSPWSALAIVLAVAGLGLAAAWILVRYLVLD